MGFGAFLNSVDVYNVLPLPGTDRRIHEHALEMLLNFKFETLKLIFPTLPSF